MQANDRNSVARALECCKNCDCDGGFKKVLHLDTGVVIYLHRGRSFARQVCPGKDHTFILHNTSATELEKNPAIAELSKYKTKCTTCRTVIHRVRSLLQEITAIRRNETYAICEHCLNTEIKCKRCEYIVTKFHADQKKQLEERDQRFKLWSCKVKMLLETILKRLKMGCHRLGQETTDTIELEKLLEELKPPLPRLYETGQAWTDNLYQSKDMLQEIILQLKLQGVRTRYSSEDSLYVSLSRADRGRNTVEDLKKQTPALEPLIKSQPEERNSTLKSKSSETTLEPPHPTPLNSEERNLTFKSKPSKEVKSTLERPPTSPLTSEEKTSKEKSKSSKEVKTTSQGQPPTSETSEGKRSKEKSKTSKEVKSPVKSKSEVTTKSKKEKKDHSDEKEEDDELDFAKLLKKSKEEEKKRAKEQKDLSKKSKEPSPVPKPKKEPIKKPADTFRKKNLEIGSILEDNTSDATCKEATPKLSEEMIKGIKIVPLEERRKTTDTLIHSFLDKLKSSVEEKKETVPMGNQTMVDKEQESTGIIKYRLSDRKFIENGWTQLPTMKVLRRMNIYKMIPSSPDWFELHKDQHLMYYGSGETLAQIDIGGGKWYYKNGSVALDCLGYDEGTLLPRRYMVYSHEDDSTKAQTILACFDYYGNGIVYDSGGNGRLKYNQSEGIVIDEKIGPPCLWKWHTLNDPPNLQEIFVDTHPKNPSPEIEEIIRRAEHKKVDGEKQCHSNTHMHPLDTKCTSRSVLHCGRKNDSLLAIELQNYAKETHMKLAQKFQRLQIRMKAVKINDYFSLKVFDQSNIYLLFRDRALTLKLNLGMLLQSDEIIDVDISETNNVTTPYDRLAPRSNCFKRVHDAFRAVKASIESKQTFLRKGPDGNTSSISSSSVCPLPRLGISSNVGTLSPTYGDSSNVNLPRWRSVDSYRQGTSPVPCSPCPVVTTRNMPCVGSF